MGILDQIQTVVIVLMENRSFDHLLGHLRMPQYGNRAEIEGLIAPATNVAYTNFVGPEGFLPFARPDAPYLHDLPHGRAQVAIQLAENAAGRFTMSGFVDAYQQATGAAVQDPSPMGFLTPADAPMSHFLATEYTVCDHWFAPIPTDTHPNRCVAVCGQTLIDDTKTRVIPVAPGTLVLDWLDAHQIPWRVYHSGLSFFSLFGRADLVLGPSFRAFSSLAADVLDEPAATFPQVIIIEPEYDDSPIHLNGPPNDNHPPLPIGPGEQFLRDIYVALTANPQRWNGTLLVVTHDEHGGFFDHVPPAPIPTPVPANALFTVPFDTTGPRVPALLASPWLARGTTFSGLMDHTSILQLLSEKFAGTPDYTDEVARRRAAGVQSASAVLAAAPGTLRADVPQPPPLPPPATPPAGVLPVVAAAVTENQKAFAAAGLQLLAQNRTLALQKFPELAYLIGG